MTTAINLLRKKIPRHLSQFLATLAVSLGPFSAGIGKGYSSPAMVSLRESNFDAMISNKVDKWLPSLSLLGAMFGCIFGGFLLKLGRKKSILLVTLPFAASWFLTMWADKYIELIYCASFTGGFCSAIILLASQVYVSEISHPDIRGLLSFILKMATHLGTLVAYSLGAKLKWDQLAFVSAIPPILLFIAILPLPETPSYLLYHDKDDDAFKSIKWLRCKEVDVTEELDTLKKNIKSKSKKIIPKCSSQLVQLLLITCGLMATQKFSGVTVFPYYAVDIFTKISKNCTSSPITESYVQMQALSSNDTDNATIHSLPDAVIMHKCIESTVVLEERNVFLKIFGFSLSPHSAAITAASIQFFGSMASGLVIDTVGRLPLLVISNLFISISYFVFGLYDWWEDNQPGNHPGFGPSWDWIPLTCVIVFTLFSAVGIGSITQLMISEIFPLEYRNFGSAVSTCFGYFVAFVAVNTFVDINSNIGLHGAFWIYTGVSVAGLMFIYLCVPETRGELEEMELPNARKVESRQSVTENHGSFRNLPFRTPTSNSYVNMISEPEFLERRFNYMNSIAPCIRNIPPNTILRMQPTNNNYQTDFHNPIYQQPDTLRTNHHNIIEAVPRPNKLFSVESLRRLRGTDV